MEFMKDHSYMIYSLFLRGGLYKELSHNITTNILPYNIQEMFGAKVTFNPDTDIPDLTGKVAIVTGGMA